MTTSRIYTRRLQVTTDKIKRVGDRYVGRDQIYIEYTYIERDPPVFFED